MSLQRSASSKRRKMKSLYVFLVSVFCVLGFMQQGSLAFSISGSGLANGGSFVGEITYVDFSDELEVSLTNTSTGGNGGFLTAFAMGTDPGLTASTLSTAGSFENILSPINVAPFGMRYIGASATTKGKPSTWWQGGGKPGGLAPTDSATFTFTLAGDTSGLTEQDFQNEISSSPFFVARFRGFDDGNSDKAQAVIVNPEPATIALLGIGIAGLAVAEVSRRRKKKAADKS
jgi:hypothetical protein